MTVNAGAACDAYGEWEAVTVDDGDGRSLEAGRDMSLTEWFRVTDAVRANEAMLLAMAADATDEDRADEYGRARGWWR